MRARRNLFQEALEAGHLVIEHGKPYLVGSVGFEAALLDLTARAREWVKAVREHRGPYPCAANGRRGRPCCVWNVTPFARGRWSALN